MRPWQPDERRTAPRRPASGEVHLQESGTGSGSGSFVGQLIDVSSAGFRVRHARLALASGQVVDFQWAGGSGKALAVWTRILGQEAETGFHIVQPPA